MKYRLRYQCLTFYVVGTIFLMSAAFYNGFPLVFPDSGSYLREFIELHHEPYHPIFYSIFVGLLHWRLSLWPIVVGQSILMVFVLDRTLTRSAPGAGWVARLAVLALLTLTTSLPWYTGQIMPDFFAPITVLLVYLASVFRDDLSKLEYYVLLLILCVAQACHFTHIGITVGLLGCLAVGALIFRTCKLLNLLPVTATSVLAILAIVSTNFAAMREVTFSPYGSLNILDRLVAEGVAQEYLTTHCATVDYNICTYLGYIKREPRHTDWLLWQDETVLRDLGGGMHYRDEAGHLVRAIILDDPMKSLSAMLDASSTLFFNFRTGEQLGQFGEGMQIYRIVTTYFPHEAPGYMQSKQYTGRLPFNLINGIDIPVAYVSLIVLAVLLVLGIARRDAPGVTLSSIVFLALVGNAILCGGLSSGESRYQSRLIPLVTLASAIGILRSHGDPTGAKQAGTGVSDGDELLSGSHAF